MGTIRPACVSAMGKALLRKLDQQKSDELYPEGEPKPTEGEFSGVRSTAHVINVTWVGVVDDGALIGTLDENWIAGIALDIFATEPFPSVVFDPHVVELSEDHDA